MRPYLKGFIMTTKKEKAKKTLSSIGNGLLAATTAIHNGPIRSRIYEIDEEIEKLQQEKAELEAKLIS